MGSSNVDVLRAGIEVTQEVFVVYRMRDDKVVELRVYADRATALDSMNG